MTEVNPKPEEMVISRTYMPLIQPKYAPIFITVLWKYYLAEPNGSIYVGNYTVNRKSDPCPRILLPSRKRNRKISKISPLRLPAGTYNIIYWGYPDLISILAGDAASERPYPNFRQKN